MTRSRMPFQSSARLVAAALSVIIAATTAQASPNILTVERKDPTSENTDADALTWLLTFSEPVTDVDATDFVVSGTTASLSLSPLAVDGEGCSEQWDATLSGGDLKDLNATVTLSPANFDVDDHSACELRASGPCIWGCIGSGEAMTHPGPYGTNNNTFVLTNSSSPSDPPPSPTPQTLAKVSGDAQIASAGSVLSAPFVVEVEDQNGDPFAGAEVAFSVTAGGGTLSAATATTDANGRASSTLTLGPAPGANAIAATVSGLGTVTFTATATAIVQTPQSLTKVSGDAQEASAGSVLPAPFVVAVKDQNGSPFAGAEVAFSVTAGGGTLSAATATTDASGRVSSTLTLGPAPGANAVAATVSGLGTVTFTATATAIVQTPQNPTEVSGDAQEASAEVVLPEPSVVLAPQTLAKVSGDAQEALVGAVLSAPFVVKVADQNGDPFAGAEVAFSVTTGGGTLSSATATTDANGRVSSTLTLGPAPGANAVTATVQGLGTVTFTATAIVQIPQSLTKVSGDGQKGLASAQLVAPFVVLALDEDGEEMAGAVVTFSVTTGGGILSSASDTNPCTVKASKSSITATTTTNGQASARLTLDSEPGTNTVAATIQGLEPVTFTATAAEQASPHSLTKVCGDSQRGTVSRQLAKPFVVSVAAADSSAIAGVVVSFAVTAGGGTLAAVTDTTDANGRAATRLTLGSELGTNAVSATVEGLASVSFTATGEEDPLASLFDLFNQSGKLAALPDRTQLLPNAPNPFNSQTVLSYFLQEPGLVRLEVFALTGQRVAVLHQGPQEAGYHRLHWDGQDAAGHPAASGIYLYRLKTSEDVLTRKLILLR